MDLSAISFELWESNLSSSYLGAVKPHVNLRFHSVSPEPSPQTIPAIHIYFARRARALIGLRVCASRPIAQHIAVNIHLAVQMMYVICIRTFERLKCASGTSLSACFLLFFTYYLKKYFSYYILLTLTTCFHSSAIDLPVLSIEIVSYHWRKYGCRSAQVVTCIGPAGNH